MTQQITDHVEDIGKSHETWRRLSAYIVFGLSMGFLFGTLVHSLLVGALFGLAIGSLAVIRPDSHRRATIGRESACTERAATSELDAWGSAIILPARYGAEAAFSSVKRADGNQDGVQGNPAWVRTPRAITGLERRTPSGSNTVH